MELSRQLPFVGVQLFGVTSGFLPLTSVLDAVNNPQNLRFVFRK